jgi:hypothetical protein
MHWFLHLLKETVTLGLGTLCAVVFQLIEVDERDRSEVTTCIANGLSPVTVTVDAPSAKPVQETHLASFTHHPLGLADSASQPRNNGNDQRRVLGVFGACLRSSKHWRTPHRSNTTLATA